MKTSSLTSCLIIALLYGSTSLVNASLDLTQSQVTEVVKQVSISDATNKHSHSAKKNDIFSTPEILKTGTASRAELTAKDGTITRIGSNTVFSYADQGRNIQLQKGSVLFHSPHGRGGGTIHTAAASAAVTGTTIIVSATKNGGFKVLVLEGNAKVTLLNGVYIKLHQGQLTFVTPGHQQSLPVIDFRLLTQIKKCLLIQGFKHGLPSILLIQEAIALQEDLLKHGHFKDTLILVGDFPDHGFWYDDLHLNLGTWETVFKNNRVPTQTGNNDSTPPPPPPPNYCPPRCFRGT